MDEKEVARVSACAKILRQRLLSRRPFYGNILVRLCEIVPREISAYAATDGKMIEFNPEYTKELSIGAINFVLLHEMYHIFLMHAIRFKQLPDKYHSIYNIAADYVINWSLAREIEELRRDCKIELEIPPTGLFLKDSDGTLVDLKKMTTEMIYYELLKNAKHYQAGGLSGGTGKGKADQDPPQFAADYHHPLADDLKPCDLSNQEVNDIKREIQAIANAARNNKWELGSSGIEDEIIEITLRKTKINWRRYLRKYLSNTIVEESSYLTPEKKYLPYDLILPGVGLVDGRSLGHVVATIDTSGSMKFDDIKEIIRNVYTIACEYQCEVTVILWTTRIEYEVHIEEGKLEEILENLPYISGGTDPSCVFERVSSMKDMTCLLLFTDGGFSIPSITKKMQRKTMIALPQHLFLVMDLKELHALEQLGKVVSI